MSSDEPRGDEPGNDALAHADVGAEQIKERAELLPEEQTVGSDDPLTQAEVILAESRERTENVDPEASTQSGRRRSQDTV